MKESIIALHLNSTSLILKGFERERRNIKRFLVY